jgi:hypothetical protein
MNNTHYQTIKSNLAELRQRDLNTIKKTRVLHKRHKIMNVLIIVISFINLERHNSHKKVDLPA